MTEDIRPEPHRGANRWQRFADWDERPLRLDRFAVEDAENGFAAFNGAAIQSREWSSRAGGSSAWTARQPPIST